MRTQLSGHTVIRIDTRLANRVNAQLNKPTNFDYPSKSHLVEKLLRDWLKGARQ